MPTACTFSFNIAAWHAVSNRLATPEQWREWAAGRLNAQTLPEHKPALAFLPAMQRRRLGAAARLVQPGDVVIIMSYVLLSEPEIAVHRPKVVLVDAQNKIRDVIDYELANTVL